MSISIYSPAIGQINLNFTSLESIQNIENINPIFTPLQPVDELISPLVVAQYALYNVDLEEDNFGLDDIDYLGYRGGFITAGDKVNYKLGNFTVAGNLTAHEVGYFFNNIDVKNTPLKNNKRANSFFNFAAEVYNTEQNNRDVMTVGDFREFRYPLGMIMLWSGDQLTLERELPYWRLCAPPDSGNTINGVYVPNLEGSFIVGANYEGFNQYSPRDNDQARFGPTISLTIGTTGGYNGVYLLADQIPSHNHNVLYDVSGGANTLTSSVDNTFRLYVSGGKFVPRIWNGTSEQCYNNEPPPVSKPSDRCTPCKGGSKPFNCCKSESGLPYYTSTFYPTITSVPTTISSADFISRSISIVDNPLIITSVTEETLGDNIAHENRPPFFTLCYIINVGQER